MHLSLRMNVEEEGPNSRTSSAEKDRVDGFPMTQSTFVCVFMDHLFWNIYTVDTNEAAFSTDPHFKC